jgi:hypothetical protein
MKLSGLWPVMQLAVAKRDNVTLNKVLTLKKENFYV